MLATRYMSLECRGLKECLALRRNGFNRRGPGPSQMALSGKPWTYFEIGDLDHFSRSNLGICWPKYTLWNVGFL